MRDTIFIILMSIILILILNYSGYDNPEKIKKEKTIRLIEIVDPEYDKKHPKKF